MSSESDYISGLLTQFDWYHSEFGNPIHLQSGGFMLCLSGSGSVVIDTKQYRIEQWTMAVAFPYSIVQLLEASEDFECVIMGVGVDFFANIQIPNKSLYFTNIKENPCITLSSEEANKILTLNHSLRSAQQNNEHPFRSEIDEAIYKIVLYETAAIYHKREPNAQQQRTREEEIFNRFIFELFSEVKEHRNLSYYAQNQHITASHLSKAVKRVSNRTASDWVISSAMMSIKTSLRQLDQPISAVAEEHHFPNCSFFSQYFKKYAGLTPMQYRDRLKRK